MSSVQGIELPTVVYTNNSIAYSGFVGNWANSTKTPDLCYSPRIDGVPTVFPTIVLESGWSESQTHLENDCKLWLEGSAGAVKVVLLYKLFEPNVLNEIKVTLHVCRIVDGAVVITLFVCSSLPCHIFFSLHPTNQPSSYRKSSPPPPSLLPIRSSLQQSFSAADTQMVLIRRLYFRCL